VMYKELYGSLGFALFATAISALVFLAGYWSGCSDVEAAYRNRAVERGHAEWIIPDNPRDKNGWRWIEPEEEGE